MIKYIKIELSLHGLEEKNIKEVCQRIKKCIETEFDTSHNSDVEIELIEKEEIYGV